MVFCALQKDVLLHKKWRFPLRISSVNVIKSADLVNLLKKSLMENFIFIFCAAFGACMVGDMNVRQILSSLIIKKLAWMVYMKQGWGYSLSIIHEHNSI